MVVIIAKYKEDIEWARNLPDVIVYDKSDTPVIGAIKLENVGRESDTYLRYIIDNYYNLPENITFLQGNPFDHTNGCLEYPYTNTMTPFNTHIIEEPIDQYPGLHMREYFRDIFGINAPDKLKVIYGAQFTVHRDRILSRSIKFYRTLLSMLNNETDFDLAHYHNKYLSTEINGWIMERLWVYIFLYTQI